MNIHVEWDNDEKTIMRYDFGENWTWDDFRNANDISDRMFAEVEHTVDLIANLEGATAPPLGALSHLKYAKQAMPENGGAVFVVGGGLMISTLVSAFSRVFKAIITDVTMADSMDDARAKITALRKDANGTID